MTKHLRTSVAAFAALAVVLVGCETDDTADTTDVDTETLDDGSDVDNETLDDGSDLDADTDTEADADTEG